MPPTLITKARGTGVLSDETRRVRDVTDSLIQLEPDAGPLTSLLAKLRKEVTTDPKIEWFEDELLPRYDTLSAPLAAGDSSMTPANPSRFRAGDLVWVNQDEVILVSATPAAGATTVSITRGFGEVSAKAAPLNGQLRILSSADSENATSRDLLSTQKQPQFNYTQIFKHPFAVSRTASKTKTFAGKDLLTEQANALIEHKKDIELMILLGQRKEDASGTQPRRASRGIRKAIVTNVQDMGGTMPEMTWEKYLRRPCRYGRKEKMIFGSSMFTTVINGYGRDKLQTLSKDKTYGISMSLYQNAGRMLTINEHPLLENDSQTDLSGVASEAIIIDIADLKLRYLEGALTTLSTNIQENDRDGRKDQYLSECGLEMHQERMHGRVFGVQG